MHSWAFNEGQDFLADHASPNIDFIAFHHWPDNWLDNTTAFEASWIAKHITDAASLNKPVTFSLTVSLLIACLHTRLNCSHHNHVLFDITQLNCSHHKHVLLDIRSWLGASSHFPFCQAFLHRNPLAYLGSVQVLYPEAPHSDRCMQWCETQAPLPAFKLDMCSARQLLYVSKHVMAMYVHLVSHYL